MFLMKICQLGFMSLEEGVSDERIQACTFNMQGLLNRIEELCPEGDLSNLNVSWYRLADNLVGEVDDHHFIIRGRFAQRIGPMPLQMNNIGGGVPQRTA